MFKIKLIKVRNSDKYVGRFFKIGEETYKVMEVTISGRYILKNITNDNILAGGGFNKDTIIVYLERYGIKENYDEI